MAELSITSTSKTDLTSGIANYSVGTMQTDGAYTDETVWDNNDFNKWYAYYRKVDKVKRAFDAYATWILGKGYTSDGLTMAALENIKGWGEDTFNSVIWNMIIMKKTNGDAYAQIIRNDNETLINLKVLSPARVRTVCDKNGIVDRYEYLSTDGRSVMKKLKPSEVLHLVNNRVADEIHGISDIECVEWIIEAQQEALRDWRRIEHISTVRIMEVDVDNVSKLSQIKSDYKDAIKKGELLLIPKGTMTPPIDLKAPDSTSRLNWLRYLDDSIYMTLGVPKILLGGETSASEGGAKVAYIAFEPIYKREINELESDLWNQLGIKIKYGEQESIAANMQENEGKNTSQTGFQEKDTTATLTRE
jgi:hypothetical protein